jgi:Domain of unknown function (DUF4340)
MSRKQFIVVLAVLLVLGAAGAAVILSDRAAWTDAESRAGQRLVPELRISEIAGIALADAANELHLVKGKDGWVVRERADFPADTDRIGELLVKLAELKIVQRESLPESQRARLQLVEPGDKDTKDAGTRLELKDGKGTVLARVLLGKKVLKSAPESVLARGEPEATGRYVTFNGEAAKLLVVSDPLTQAETQAARWIQKELIRVDRSRSISATGGDGKPRWTVARNSESVDWRFADSAARPDLQKATDLASALYWINALDVVADPEKVDTGLGHPVVVKASTFDGLTYTLRIGNKIEDDYYLRVSVTGEPPRARIPAKGEKAEDKAKKDKEFDEGRKKLLERLGREKRLEGWTYRVAGSALAPLLRERTQLMPEEKAAKKR